jgi:lipoate-protein ligase B
LHLTGQVLCYPSLPLNRLGLTPGDYTRQLNAAVAEVVQEFGTHPQTDPERPGVWVAGRQIAQIGVAVRNWVTAFGVVVNVNPDLELFRAICCEGEPARMTSLLREATHPVRLSAVRQRLVERIAERIGFGRVSVFHHHPCLTPNTGSHAIAFRH